MTIRESVIEAAHRKIAQALGWMVVKLMQTAPNGMPDRIYISGHPKHVCRYCNRGRIVFVEWKRPGGVVSKHMTHAIPTALMGIPGDTMAVPMLRDATILRQLGVPHIALRKMISGAIIAAFIAITALLGLGAGAAAAAAAPAAAASAPGTHFWD